MKNESKVIDEEELQETLAEQTDPEFQKAMAQSEREFERGEVGTEEELFEILSQN